MKKQINSILRKITNLVPKSSPDGIAVWRSYPNLTGMSGVAAYKVEPTKIHIRFKTGRVYVYSYESAGESKVEAAKVYAATGTGLNSFIMRNMKNNYE